MGIFYLPTAEGAQPSEAVNLGWNEGLSFWLHPLRRACASRLAGQLLLLSLALCQASSDLTSLVAVSTKDCYA